MYVFGVYFTTGIELRDQVDRDLVGDVTQLAEALRPVQWALPSAADGVVARYVRAQPYSDTSKLMFVLVPGEPPISSYPADFLSSSGGLAAFARSVEINPRGAHDRLTTTHMAGVGTVRVLCRLVTIAGRTAVIGVAEPLTFVDRAQDVIARAFALVAALSLLLALIAAYLAGERVTAPLRRMAAVAARVDAGDLEPRMQPIHGAASEVSPRPGGRLQPHARPARRWRSRASAGFIADASHELRTPLTVISGQLEVLASLSDADRPQMSRASSASCRRRSRA